MDKGGVECWSTWFYGIHAVYVTANEGVVDSLHDDDVDFDENGVLI